MGNKISLNYSFKIKITKNLFTYKKQSLTLYNPKELICHKTLTNQISTYKLFLYKSYIKQKN